MIKKLFLILAIAVFPVFSWTQCAMCRTQVQNNVSTGDTDLASGLNIGILFLVITPYVALAIIAFLWFRHSGFSHNKRLLLLQRLKNIRSSNRKSYE